MTMRTLTKTLKKETYVTSVLDDTTAAALAKKVEERGVSVSQTVRELLQRQLNTVPAKPWAK
jgi:hypothetical protein